MADMCGKCGSEWINNNVGSLESNENRLLSCFRNHLYDSNWLWCDVIKHYTNHTESCIEHAHQTHNDPVDQHNYSLFGWMESGAVHVYCIVITVVPANNMCACVYGYSSLSLITTTCSKTVREYAIYTTKGKFLQIISVSTTTSECVCACMCVSHSSRKDAMYVYTVCALYVCVRACVFKWKFS